MSIDFKNGKITVNQPQGSKWWKTWLEYERTLLNRLGSASVHMVKKCR